MIVSDIAVQNRTTVFFLTALILVAGLFSYYSLPRESAPDVQVPYVFINTYYQGVSPEDIEKSVTTQIEDKLKGLSGVKQITSLSSEGHSMINVEFVTGTDIDNAIIKVKDKVDQAKPDLPTDLDDEPLVDEFNFSEMPILTLSLAGGCGLRQLTSIAEDLQDEIETVEGVLEVELTGDVEREIQIQIRPERMALYGITFTELQSIVSSENQDVSGGAFRTDEGKYQLRVPGEFKNVNDLESIVVATRGGAPIYLRDLAHVVDGLEDMDSLSRVNGNPAVTINIKKRSGENIINIVDAVDKILEQSKASWPAGVKVYRMMDGAKEIRNMLADLENNIISGLLLVVIVVCIAMGLRNAILVSLSIPLSMLITFVVLRMLNITLNMVVLFSLTLALGMLVDNAIVIIENIYRYMQEGVSRLVAARRATSEVAWPIIGSGLTTIGAFVPMLWWDGVMGSFMVYLPKTVIITLVSCLFVALVINPAMAAVVMSVKKKDGAAPDGPDSEDDKHEHGWRDISEHPMLSGGGKILQTYRRVLRFALQYRLAVVAFSCFVTVAMMIFWYWRVGMERQLELFPAIDPQSVQVNMTLPQGAGLDYCDNLVRDAGTRLYDKRAGTREELSSGIPFVKYPDAIQAKEHTLVSSGKPYQSPSDLPNIEFSVEKASTEASTVLFGGGTSTQVTIQFVDFTERSERTVETLKTIASRMETMTGAEILVEQVKQGPPTGSPINIEISGDNFDTLGRLAERAKAIIRRVDFVKNVRDDFEEGAPTIRVQVDRKRAALLGLSTEAIGFAVKAAINGVTVSTYRDQDDDYDVVVRFDEKDRKLIETLQRTFIPSSEYGNIPLTTVAAVEYVGGLGSINRIDHRRVVTVKADVDETNTTGATARMMAEKLIRGSYELTVTDVQDWSAFVAAVHAGAHDLPTQSSSWWPWVATELHADGSTPAQRVWSLLPAEIRLVLTSWDSLTDANQISDAKRHLLNAVNAVLSSKTDLYDKAAFSQCAFDDQTTAVLAIAAEKLKENQFIASGDSSVEKLNEETKTILTQANRLLLEAAFPDLIVKSANTQFILPLGYRYEFTGENEDQQETGEFLGWALSVAILLILLILVAQFDSVIYPMIIMSAVILSLAGVFMGLGICDMTFGLVMTGVGVISLAGVVVNNGIVLVDYIRLLRSSGMPKNDAIVAAGATRLRPVMLTAVTTVLGLIPMATGKSIDFHSFSWQSGSESSQWWASMAIAVIFGLILATLLTLVVVPVLFSLSESLVPWTRRIVRMALRKTCYPLLFYWWRQFDMKYGTDFAAKWR